MLSRFCNKQDNPYWIFWLEKYTMFTYMLGSFTFVCSQLNRSSCQRWRQCHQPRWSRTPWKKIEGDNEINNHGIYFVYTNATENLTVYILVKADVTNLTPLTQSLNPPFLRINKIFENITTFPSSFNPYNDQNNNKTITSLTFRNCISGWLTRN